MPELAFVTLPIKRFVREMSRWSEPGWLLVVTAGALLGLLSYGSYRFGLANANQMAIVVNYFLTVSLLAGLWLGFAKAQGDRPVRWRLTSRASWFYGELGRGLALLLMTSLVTAISFGVGAATSQGLSWWQITLVSALLLVTLSTVAVYNSALAILIKALSRNVAIRLLLLAALTFGSLSVLDKLGPLVSAFAHNWEVRDADRLLLTLLLVLGLLGVAIAVAELILPHQHTQPLPTRRYWPLRLPTQTLGGFGAGTAVLVSEIVYHLRSTRVTRRLLGGIVVLAVGLATLNFFTDTYQANAQTLFYGLTALVLGFLALSIASSSGQNAEARVDRYRQWPVSASKIRGGFLAANLVITAMLAVITIELFAATILPTAQIILLGETALLVSLVGFTSGQAAWQLKKNVNDPLIIEVVRATVALLVVVMASIMLFFQGVVAPVITGLALIVWAGGIWLVAERQRQRALANTE